MKEIKKVLIAGAGSIGSMVASTIQKNSPNTVSILAGGERLERYKTQGFIINNEKCSLSLTDVNSHTDPDLVIIACKFHHLSSVISDLKNHIGNDTLILSLLNGISSEEIIGAAFGEYRIPLAMIVGTDAGHKGNITTYSKLGTIFFGDSKNSLEPHLWSPRIQAISNFFDKTHIAYEVPQNMLNRLWFKFMMNVGLNQITAILRQPYKFLKSSSRIPETAELFDAAMNEVVLIANAENILLNDQDITEIYRIIDSLADEGKTSMCQDVEAGRKTEVELFSLTVMQLGKKHGIPVPVNTILFRMLRSIEESF